MTIAKQASLYKELLGQLKLPLNATPRHLWSTSGHIIVLRSIVELGNSSTGFINVSQIAEHAASTLDRTEVEAIVSDLGSAGVFDYAPIGLTLGAVSQRRDSISLTEFGKSLRVSRGQPSR